MTAAITAPASWWLRGMLLASSLLLGACARQSVQPPLASHFPGELPAAIELVGLPHYPQQDNQCGPASLATVLAHSGIQVTPEQLRPDIYLPGRGGSLAIELVARTRQYQRLAYRLAPDLGALLTELAAGNPVLVLQNLRFDWWPHWHYAVVIGYDLGQQQLLLRSGDRARYAIPMSLFEKTWARAQHWAVVVTRPEQLPASAEPLRFMAAAADLEASGQSDAASAAYGAALERWPEQPLALLGLGNSAFQRSEYRLAAGYYERLVRALPHSAAGWNNRAYALLHLGCPAAAEAAVQCAIALAPQASSYRHSLDEIRNSGGTVTATTCPAIHCPDQP
ncbi:PA2778 family cysteine peptidase [Pseudomaricurvus alcaniphilus]|uniref:PA2778 family cysteine peptidase n=1 Tax=Pseudomaricurvus alcaniphilus TaxID=1166482 RepID=UPI00140BA026|nr:PA2778 family cysteine peptidase [Pseudomaricurvus alcaniphilus]NHN36960.1 PA2778 family cysteine peptidase [Pseudomaricurvus alcaniphilus]